ncbi:MAG: class II aldolase/adducin family protein [Pirellulaceae bacterium]|nr:class II aldolase/adducin family protein [Pirellulaceae bacterium]
MNSVPPPPGTLHPALVPLAVTSSVSEIWTTILSDQFAGQGGFEIAGYEMLKGLDGITTQDTSWWVEIFENTQHIPSLTEQVRQLEDVVRPLKYGYLIRKHGLYTWGRDLDEARRHLEIFEFLLECVAPRLILRRTAPAGAF